MTPKEQAAEDADLECRAQDRQFGYNALLPQQDGEWVVGVIDGGETLLLSTGLGSARWWSDDPSHAQRFETREEALASMKYIVNAWEVREITKKKAFIQPLVDATARGSSERELFPW